ncbi:MAG: trigger factor [Bryobacterales bacterium]|nr:trigger factor [Bryobacterales bacterium]
MALLEGCRHSLEISIPVDAVETETQRVLASIQKRAKFPGFRPGKVPVDLVRRNYSEEIRQQVVENLVPRFFRERVESEDLKVVGAPQISDVKYEAGQPLHFKAEFEVAPVIELQEYKGLTVTYADPEITEEDIARRLDELRHQKADYANVDPRPLEDGDYAVVSLESLAGVEGEPIRQDELMLEIGGADTLAGFSENLRGASPGEEREFDVAYPEDYGQARLSGRTVRFRALVKGIRRKELPELNDEFAQDVGDYLNLEELREAVRKALFAERQFAAQREAKDRLVDQLVDLHDFPVPEAYVEQQLRNRAEQTVRSLAAGGVDLKSFQLDWEKFKDSQREKALREVKASLLLERIAEREAVEVTRDEVDREVDRIARQRREPAAAVRVRLEKDGSLRNIAAHIQTEKTLAFLFEHARKEPPEESR